MSIPRVLSSPLVRASLAVIGLVVCARGPALGQQTPFSGSPIPIPGIVEGESFDEGGEGISYHDWEAANLQGAYRQTGVDLEDCSEGGYNVSSINPGEWVEYTLDVTRAGAYLLQARVASVTDAGSFHVEIDGVVVSPIIAVDATGSWQTWTTVRVGDVSLVAGEQVMRIHFDGGPFNLNWVRFDSYDDMATSVIEACAELEADLRGEETLTGERREELLDAVLLGLGAARVDSARAALLSYTGAYESLHPPLYHDGVMRRDEELPFHARATLWIQSGLFELLATTENVSLAEGMVFEHHEVIPGPVAPGTPRIPTATVEIDGTYHVDVAAELTDQSRVVRPTGYYAAPGEVVTIEAPARVLGEGLVVHVGAHFRNLVPAEIGPVNRFQDICAEYDLDAETIRVVSPFGGGIYVRVPDGAEAGWFPLTIRGAICSPYFSYRRDRETSVVDWLAEVATTGAPWADFESDSFFFTVPTSALEGIDEPAAIMERWDAIMATIQRLAGRPVERPRAEYYLLDTRLVTPAYGAGYPMVIPLSHLSGGSGWNPLEVLTVRPSGIFFHEMGHNHLHPMLNFGPEFDPCHSIEAETIVHMLAVSVYSEVYGLSKEAAFEISGGYVPYSFEEAVFDWIITTNFRNDLPMTFDESAPLEDRDMLKYQPRGWAKYADVARLFGWDGLGQVNGQFYTPGQPAQGVECDWRPFVIGRDEYIRAASEALGVDMTPLFHFWGIRPSEELRLEMASTYPRSDAIRELIVEYRDTVAPRNRAEYVAFHESVYDRLGYQTPRYDDYLERFDASFAEEIQDQFDYLLELYFGAVAPPSPRGLTARVDGLSVVLDWDDELVGDLAHYRVLRSEESGGPYQEIGRPVVSELVDGDVEGGRAYFYVVSAVDVLGLESSTSEEVSAAVEAIAPPAPRGLTARVDGLSVVLDWDDDPAVDLAHYRVLRSDAAGGSYREIGRPIVSELVDRDVVGGRTYFYVVSVVDIRGLESPTSEEVSAAVEAIAPPAPRGLAATVDGLLVALDWDDAPSTAVAHYRVFRSDAAGGSYREIGRPVVSELVDRDVDGGRTYFYVVTTVDVSGLESPASAEVSAALVSSAPRFRRGDANGDAELTIADAIYTLSFLFLGTASPRCLDALDFDDSGEIDLGDPVSSLGFQFLGGRPPALPGIATCGVDPTDSDPLGCDAYAGGTCP